MAPERVHRRKWGEEAHVNYWVADDGACLWRDHLRAREIHRTAITELKVGEVPEVGLDGLLSSRALDAATVRKRLDVLRGVNAEFGNATYLNFASWSSWGIVEIISDWDHCGETAVGVALALNRKTGAWQSRHTLRGPVEGDGRIRRPIVR